MLSCSLLVPKMSGRHQHQIPVIRRRQARVLYAVKPLVTLNGQLPIPASSLPYTSYRCLPQIQRIYHYSRSQSQTLTRHSGACSTLLMLVIIYPPSVSSLERYRRTLPDLTVAEQGSASLVRLRKRRLCGRLWAKATRIVLNGSFFAPLSIFLSMFQNFSSFIYRMSSYVYPLQRRNCQGCGEEPR